MRKTAALPLVLLLACGGAPDAQKPAATPADTSSLEPQPSGSAAETTPSSAEAPAPKATAAPSAPSAAPAASAAAPAAPPAASFHAPPTATGSIDGKPFSPKVARSTSAMQKDGRLLLTLTEGADCASAKAGDGALTILVEWKDGYKTDLGSLKRATKAGGGEVGFSRSNGLSKSFKPTGRVTVVSAPTDANATGKLKLDVQSGDFMLAGDIDVLLCVAAK